MRSIGTAALLFIFSASVWFWSIMLIGMVVQLINAMSHGK